MARELAIGIRRTVLPNNWWVTTVLVPHQAEGGRYHTMIFDRPGLWGAVHVFRARTEDEWPAQHLEAAIWAREQAAVPFKARAKRSAA